jgi:putative serine protease PepD
MTDTPRDEPHPTAPGPWPGTPGTAPLGATLPTATSRDDTPPAPRRAPGVRTAALLTAAVLAAGATGGAVTGLVMHDGNATTTVAASVSRTGSTVTAASRSTGGTPEAAAAAVAASVVTLEVTGTQPAPGFGGFGGGQGPVSDTGSGIVVRSDGYILTNNHVVSAAAGGGTVRVTFSDGRTVAAKIVGQDATSDLAVVKATGAGDLKAATFADSDKLEVGQTVLAVGAPLGLSNTVTEGIVSTLNRPVATGESGAGPQAVLDAIQTDAAINPGNSGGALVDLAGNVVGVNSAIATTGSSGGSQSGNIGVGFAIPSNDAAAVADQLIATGHAAHSQLGIGVGDAGTPGATVRAVTAGGPAERAGLRVGDVVTTVADRRVTDANSLIVAVRAHAPGSVVTVTYTRGGTQSTAQVTLGTASDAS